MRYTTGYNANVVVVADGNRVFGGHYDGKLYEKQKSAILNDASETAPGAINSYRRSHWIIQPCFYFCSTYRASGYTNSNRMYWKL